MNEKVKSFGDFWRQILQVHVNVANPTSEKKVDHFRYSAIMQKVEGNHKASPETKTRARGLIKLIATDPVLRNAFQNASDASIEAFLLSDEEMQQAYIQNLPKPWFRAIQELVQSVDLEKSLPQTAKMLDEWAENLERKQARREGRPYFTKEQIRKSEEEWQAFQEWFGKAHPNITQDWENKEWVLSMVRRALPLTSNITRCSGCGYKFGFIQRFRNLRTLKDLGIELAEFKEHPRAFIHKQCALQFLLRPKQYVLVGAEPPFKRVFIIEEEQNIMRDLFWLVSLPVRAGIFLLIGIPYFLHIPDWFWFLFLSSLVFATGAYFIYA